jgi:hypothetical protein
MQLGGQPFVHIDTTADSGSPVTVLNVSAIIGLDNHSTHRVRVGVYMSPLLSLFLLSLF